MHTNSMNGLRASQGAIEALCDRTLLTVLAIMESEDAGSSMTYSPSRRGRQDDAVIGRPEARKTRVHDSGTTRSLRDEAGALYDETFEGCEDLSSKIQALHLM